MLRCSGTTVPDAYQQVQWSTVVVQGIDKHICGILANHTLVCWAQRDYDVFGQINVPASLTWSTVSVGAFHTCGITTIQGKLYCFGADWDGQISVPADVTEAAWSHVSAGRAHTCGILRDDGTLRCWGYSDFATVPDALKNAVWSDVSVGNWHTCGILNGTQALHCFGPNAYGEATVPTDVGDSAWSTVSAGDGWTCGILAGSGVMRCFGLDYWDRFPVPDP